MLCLNIDEISLSLRATGRQPADFRRNASSQQASVYPRDEKIKG